MKNVVLFDTSYGSLNLGDFIIEEAITREMNYLLSQSFCVRYPTHTPISHNLQSLLPVLSTRTCRAADYKFICGTNIVKNTLIRFARDWSINLINASLYEGAVLLGCGRELNKGHLDSYTKHLYKKIFSKEYAHSVRDDRTAEFMDSLGFKVLVTGCPTTWGLRNESVAQTYAKDPSNTVLVTLTDYAKNPQQDTALIHFLENRYERILFWPQGSRDYDYAKALGILDKVEIVPPSFTAYEAYMTRDFDYIGTRLHGGVFALRNGHRTIILSVDNRAKDMAATTGLPVVPRADFSAIEHMLDRNQPPVLNIPLDTIEQWKSQFVG